MFTHQRAWASAAPAKERDQETGLDWFTSRYFSSAQGRFASPDTPLFQRAMKKQRILSGNAMNGDDIYRMMKRRLKDFDIPLLYSPHSFRVTTITDLLE